MFKKPVENCPAIISACFEASFLQFAAPLCELINRAVDPITIPMHAPSNVQVIDHPLVRMKLMRLRDKNTPSADFRRLVRELALLMTAEITRSLETTPACVETPLAPYVGVTLLRPVIIVPILRAGLGFAEGMLDVLGEASVGHIGTARNELTALPESYYKKVPPHLASSEVIVADPMLATGGSAIDALTKLKEMGATRLRFACLVASAPGIECLTAAHPDVPVFTAEIDPALNAACYIVPGLGDAGDRYFGT